MASSEKLQDTSETGRLAAFRRLRVSPVINACGVYTDLGGSILSDRIWSVLTELNGYFVDLVALLDRSGERIAELVGSEAARITPGASAGIALSVAACIVSRQAQLGEQLPDVTGLKGEIILQKRQAAQYKYLNTVRLAGAKVVLAGDESRTSVQDLERAIGAQTGALFIPAHLDDLPGCVRIEAAAEIARRRKLPLVVDAAYMVFPPEIMRSFAARGADLTCISAKYFGGPNAGGFVCGRRDLVEAVKGLDFTRHESGAFRRFGRAFKMGRYEIAAVQLALEDWFATDHKSRLAEYARRAESLRARLAQSRKLSVETKYFTLDERLADEPVNAAVLRLRPGVGMSASELLAVLAAGYPSIRAIEMDGCIVLVTETLSDGQHELLAHRLLDALGE